MRIRGFTISEISIGMILGSLIIILGSTYISMLNQNTINQYNTYENLNQLHMLNKIIKREIRLYQPQLTDSRTITFFDCNMNVPRSTLQFYTDSIVFLSNKDFTFHINSSFIFTQDTIYSLNILFKNLPNSPSLIFYKDTNAGFKLN